jgi:toxin ParE1/3/4
MGKLIKSSRAELDLLDIWVSIATHESSAADRAIAFIERRMEVIRRFPRGGEACPDYGLNMRWYFAGYYVIYYRPFEDGIEVVRVIDGRRDLPHAFRQDH